VAAIAACIITAVLAKRAYDAEILRQQLVETIPLHTRSPSTEVSPTVPYKSLEQETETEETAESARRSVSMEPTVQVIVEERAT